LLHKIAIAIPTYHSVPTAVFAAFLQLDRKNVPVTSTTISSGVYLSAAMRSFRDNLLDSGDPFERLLIIEADMILPRDALRRHAEHTEPIVGSVYFQHSAPYMPIFTAPADDVDYHRTFTCQEVSDMLETPGLYETVNVGFGCTSIRRDVLEDWPSKSPMFGNREGLTSDGKPVEMGHDVAFMLEARRYGWKSYVDTNIVCGHISETVVTPDHFLANDPNLRRVDKRNHMGTTTDTIRNLDLAGVPTGGQVRDARS
jgi:hypothetical protein